MAWKIWKEILQHFFLHIKKIFIICLCLWGKWYVHVSAVPKEAKGDIRLPQADDCKPPALPVLCETNIYILHH